jgi:aminoglycoside phosphotransferase (APT) family kinase protein
VSGASDLPWRTEIVVDDLEGEIPFLERLAGRLPVEITVPVERGEPGPDFGYPFAIQTRVRGVPSHEADLDEVETDRLVRDTLAVLDALRAADPADDWPGTGRWPSPEMLRVSKEDVTSLLDRIADAIGPRRHHALEAHCAAPPPPPSSGPSLLCHGDLVPEHLYVDPDSRRLSGLIDWGDANFGDPAQDVAGLGFLVPPGRLAPLVDDAARLERARYRVLAAACHTVWFGVREANDRYRVSGLRTLDRWLPKE